MNIPEPGEYIDIHTHDSKPVMGVFAVENLMAHENLKPGQITAPVFTAGIHPWHLNESNRDELLKYVLEVADNPHLIAIGEAGFDKLKGPSLELQRSTFEKQVRIANDRHKPLVIHCVRAWDELLAAHKHMKPETPWMVHGFRGKKELALQLIKRGMYLSFWFDFVLRPESSDLIRFLPVDRMFLETDGADVDIKAMYQKVSGDLAISVDELKNIILNNFKILLYA